VPEFANIEAAIRAVLATGNRLDAVAVLTGFGRLTSIASLAAPVLAEIAGACHTENDVLGEALCIKSLGDIARRSDHDAARRAYEEALLLYRQVGDVQGEANCIWSLGHIALARSNHDAAHRAYEEALLLYRQIGSVLGEANCINGLGDIALARSDHDAARRSYDEALPLYPQIGSVLGEANCNLEF
jgi:tetratricopeptide (TPR) repeat protein